MKGTCLGCWAQAAVRMCALQVRRSGPQGHGSHSPTRSTHQEVKSACQALLERLRKTPAKRGQVQGLSGAQCCALQAGSRVGGGQWDFRRLTHAGRCGGACASAPLQRDESAGPIPVIRRAFGGAQQAGDCGPRGVARTIFHAFALRPRKSRNEKLLVRKEGWAALGLLGGQKKLRNRSVTITIGKP